jgi:hypothetical protein
MDLETLKRKARDAREFKHSVGGATFQIRTPTRHDVTLAMSKAGAQVNGNDQARVLLLQRSLLESAIVGWTEVRVGHVLPEDAEAGAPLAWEPGVAAELLDARPDWEESLAAALSTAMASRREALEADEKN